MKLALRDQKWDHGRGIFVLQAEETQAQSMVIAASRQTDIVKVTEALHSKPILGRSSKLSPPDEKI